MLKVFQAARLRGVPIVAVRTADQMATVEALLPLVGEFPVLQWDAARGITPAAAEPTTASASKEYKLALQVMANAKITSEATLGFVDAMVTIKALPRGAVVLVHNAHRQLQSSEPIAAAAAVQAVANLRDVFKQNFRMIVLLAPTFAAPPELAHDIVMLNQALPDTAALTTIVQEIGVSAKASSKEFVEPKGEALAKAAEAVAGLSSFEAEQQISISLTKTGLDLDALWERKRVTIEQTPGLSVYRGKETLEDLRGLTSVKTRLREHITAKTPVGVAVWIDEGADVFQNVEQDTSGVKTDQQRALLVEMEQNDWRGMIFVGVPGSGKSAVARGFGNEAQVPTIQVDFGGMESKYVGESEGNLRRAIDVIKAVGRGHAFFLLTCNSLKGIRPQFMRRFKRGTFFFDLPTAEERDAIWQLYTQKLGLPTQDRPADDAWTGAEIRECCESAWDTGKTLLEAARYIVPVARSRSTEIDLMRQEAHGRFLDASEFGHYQYKPEVTATQKRAVALDGPLAVDPTGLKRMN